jgi:NADPH-dependent 2,4-dienoyl-CoA reductase/sulfur reductase-like enzyme
MASLLICSLALLFAAFSITAASTVNCDVLIVGGGTGGVAAAHEAASRGAKTCLVAESFWLGGQITSQGTSALDEAYLDFAEPYDKLVQLIRQYYIDKYSVPPSSQFNSFDGRFDPGTPVIDLFNAPY